MACGAWQRVICARDPFRAMRHAPEAVRRTAWCCWVAILLGSGATWVAAAAETPAGLSDAACLKCHADPALARSQPGQRGRSMYVDRAVLARSQHAKAACSSCHAGITKFPHDAGSGKAVCAACHQREAKAYGGSIHGRGLARAEADVPTCQRCHGGHDILAVRDPASRVQPLHQAKVCMDCHADTRITARHVEMPNVLLVRAYTDSVHGRAVARSGLTVAPTCTSCHGTHALMAADDPGSPVHRGNVAATCGRCHQGILAEYQGSIHAVALARGVKEAPTCTSCHGEHTIAEPKDPSSKVAPRNIPKTCGACHAAEGIVGKIGLAAKRGETYADSFHGIAMKFGNSEVANCASCHGFHDIRPSSDPRSRIAKANLPATCGKCHPGAGARFAEGRVHVEKTKDSAPGVFYVRAFYTWFIGGLMVCFLGYMAVDLYGYRRRRNGSEPRMGAGR